MKGVEKKMNKQIKKESKLSLKWLYLAWISSIITSLAFGVIGAIVQGDPGPFILQLGFGDIAIFAFALHAIGMIIAVVILYFFLKGRGLGWDAVGLKGKLSLPATGYALAGVVIAFFLYPLIEVALRAVGVGMYWGAEKASHLSLTSSLDVIVVLLSTVLIAPVTEEIIFRGYILTMFTERKHKTLIAVLLSVSIFTSVHIFFGPGMMVYIFLWAFIPAFLYLKFKSLYPAILFHFLNNLIAYIILPLFGI